VVWCSGNGVCRINEVTRRRARLVLRWMTVFWRKTTSICNQPTASTQSISFWVAKSSTSLIFLEKRYHLCLVACDPASWHVSSRSEETGCKLLYSVHLLHTYLLMNSADERRRWFGMSRHDGQLDAGCHGNSCSNRSSRRLRADRVRKVVVDASVVDQTHHRN